MKSMKITITVLIVLLGIVANGSALAWHHHGHVRFGVFLGAPAWYYPGPYYYGPPYYYPSVVAVPASPPVYAERGDGYAEPGRSDAYWYYCADSRAYYPYVKECPGGWQRVVPQPPSAQ